MPYSVHLLHRGGHRDRVHEGSPQSCAIAFFEYIAKGALVSLASGQAKMRTTYVVRIRDAAGRKVIDGDDMEVFRRGHDFVGYSHAARLMGLLRGLPVSVSALLGEAQHKALARSAAEGRGISDGMLWHIHGRIIATTQMLNFAEQVAASAVADDADDD